MKRRKSCCSNAGEYISYANCGLPYHVGDVIKTSAGAAPADAGGDEKASSAWTSASRTKCSPSTGNKKTVLVKKTCGNGRNLYRKPYDTLVISTGSSPLKPPIPGIDSSRVQTLWTIPDTDRIRALVREQGVKSVVAVIGGGFIGLEMAENLKHAGLDVSLIEALDQVMSPIDFEMAQLLHETLVQNGVELHLSDAVESFNDVMGGVDIKLKSGKVVTAELVILSIGVRPNGQLAKDAGLKRSTRAAASWSTTICSPPILRSTPWET